MDVLTVAVSKADRPQLLTSLPFLHAADYPSSGLSTFSASSARSLLLRTSFRPESDRSAHNFQRYANYLCVITSTANFIAAVVRDTHCVVAATI